jgi:hypothetical protein
VGGRYGRARGGEGGGDKRVKGRGRDGRVSGGRTDVVMPTPTHTFVAFFRYVSKVPK